MPEEEAPRTKAARGRFLKRRTWWCRLLALPFLGACAGIAVVWAIYRWPTTNLVVSSLAPVPPFVCLFALLPGLFAGILAVRRFWFFLGLAAWLGAVFVLDECGQVLKPFPGRARTAFAQARERHDLEQRSATGPPSWAAMAPLRIVTWNVHEDNGLGGSGLEKVAELTPDLVFLQECGIRALRKAMARTQSFTDYYIDGDENCILSRFPLVRVPDVELPEWRGSVWALEVTPGVAFYCINVHMGRYLLTPNLVRYWNPREVQTAAAKTGRRLGQLGDTIQNCQRRGPVVLAGDFNLPPYYPDLRRITGGLRECFASNGYGWGKTVRANLPLLRIDMLFVPLGAQVYYTAAFPGPGSDHRMVLAEVAIPLAGAGPVQATGRPVERSAPTAR